MKGKTLMDSNRHYRYDNIRFILILLVITGHGLEQFLYGISSATYRIIYSFHMPAFIFLTGKFARYDRDKIIKHYIIPYFIFQTLFLCFDASVLKDETVVLQYTTPYWVLWFLMSVIFYYLFMPLLPSSGSRNRYFAIVLSLVISLLVGYDSSVGYYLSLSRSLVFAPFFLWGYYEDALFFKTSKRNHMLLKTILCLLFIIAGEIYILKSSVPISLLYCSRSYASAGATILDRAIVLITATAWICLLDIIVPDQKLPIITSLGQTTMPLFISHAFIMRLLEKYYVFHYSLKVNLIILFFITVAIFLVFGNKYFKKIFSKIF